MVDKKYLAEANVTVYDPIAVAQVISDWCWNNPTYVYDPMTTEAEDYFVHPYLLIKDYTERGFAAGDCDDFAVPTASMLLGRFNSTILALGAKSDAPDAYTHITTALYTPEYKNPDLVEAYYGWPYTTLKQQ